MKRVNNRIKQLTPGISVNGKQHRVNRVPSAEQLATIIEAGRNLASIADKALKLRKERRRGFVPQVFMALWQLERATNPNRIPFGQDPRGVIVLAGWPNALDLHFALSLLMSAHDSLIKGLRIERIATGGLIQYCGNPDIDIDVDALQDATTAMQFMQAALTAGATIDATPQRTYLHSAIAGELANMDTTTLSGYVRKAGITPPQRGERTRCYTPEERFKIITCVAEQGSQKKNRDAACAILKSERNPQ